MRNGTYAGSASGLYRPLYAIGAGNVFVKQDWQSARDSYAEVTRLRRAEEPREDGALAFQR